jgi:hypothetical protein
MTVTLTARDTAGHVKVAVAALGDTPDAIAAALSAAGATGRRESSSHCPVAAYLLADCVPPGTSVSVGTLLITLTPPVGRPAFVRTPGPVHAFLTAFDSGAYPHLIGGTR